MSDDDNRYRAQLNADNNELQDRNYLAKVNDRRREQYEHLQLDPVGHTHTQADSISKNGDRIDAVRAENPESRHLALNFFEVVTRICTEKNVSKMLDKTIENSDKQEYRIYYTADKKTDTPYLVLTWKSGKTGNVVKISMSEHTKPFRKQVKLDKPLKYEDALVIALDTLVKQNEAYIETKQMIENCVSQLHLDAKPEYIRRTKTLWHVSYKKGNLRHSIVIQYDERSKEFLFQKRYIDSDDVVTLVNSLARTENEV